jgi:hypothetical protein
MLSEHARCRLQHLQPLADIAGRTKPIDTELLELARILAK